MNRRAILGSAAALLAAPTITRAQPGRVLRFIPQADLSILDPLFSTRNHGFMVFDTLYGTDSAGRASPQMLEGHTIEDDGRRWTLTLRSGLLWHDATPVLARDCVASIRRWGAKDSFGQALLAATDALEADGDRRIVFRLKRPFPRLPDALGKTGLNIPAMMPERLASTDPATPIAEMVGSGPFRFKADERIPGARAVWVRNETYLPRTSGTPDGTAGPKLVHLDRVEWITMPDPATAAAALQTAACDWWDFASADFLPILRRDKDLQVTVLEPLGKIAVLRLNHLQPPFNNPAIRRAVLGAIRQSDFMIAMMGEDTALWRENVGFFPPEAPLANDSGMDALTGPRNEAQARQALLDAGYRNERVVLVVPTDFPNLKALSDVAADMLRKIGLNVDYQATDWGTLLARRSNRGPLEQGGWSAFCTFSAGIDQTTPAGNLLLRTNGPRAWFGWPDDPEIETLRDAWFTAPDLQAERSIAAALQHRAFETLPYIPLGQYFQPTAYRTALSGVLGGFPIFWNLRKA